MWSRPLCIIETLNSVFSTHIGNWNIRNKWFNKSNNINSKCVLKIVTCDLYRGRLLLRTPGPVPFGTCIWSNVETILSWNCHVYGPFKFRTSLGTSILLVLRTTLLTWLKIIWKNYTRLALTIILQWVSVLSPGGRIWCHVISSSTPRRY